MRLPDLVLSVCARPPLSTRESRGDQDYDIQRKNGILAAAWAADLGERPRVLLPGQLVAA